MLTSKKFNRCLQPIIWAPHFSSDGNHLYVQLLGLSSNTTLTIWMYGDKVGYPQCLLQHETLQLAWTLTCIFLDPRYRMLKIPKAKWSWKGVENLANIERTCYLYWNKSMLSIWHFTLKSDKEKSTNSADLVQENSFSPTYFLSLFRLVKKGGKAVHLLEKSVINMNRQCY